MPRHGAYGYDKAKSNKKSYDPSKKYEENYSFIENHIGMKNYVATVPPEMGAREEVQQR